MVQPAPEEHGDPLEDNGRGVHQGSGLHPEVMRAGLVPDVGRDVGGEVAIGVDGAQTKVDDEPPEENKEGTWGGQPRGPTSHCSYAAVVARCSRA